MITVRLAGGMGNQMFQYALGRALSLKHSVPLKLDTTFLENQTALPFVRAHFVKRSFALDVFTIDAILAAKEDIPWWGRPFFKGAVMQIIDALLRKIPILPGWERSFHYDPHVLDLGPDVYLAGFWQSEKYFAEYSETIKKDFSLQKPLSGNLEILFQEIKNCISVCVHIRRSDIAAASFHGGLDISYYNSAIAYIAKMVAIEKIYVFSDDIEWAKENLVFAYPVQWIGNEYDAGVHGENHMALMRECTHFVIANSTFSWWAAWLGTKSDKIVIAPKHWFSNGLLDDRDLVPKEWVRI